MLSLSFQFHTIKVEYNFLLKRQVLGGFKSGISEDLSIIVILHLLLECHLR